MSTKWQTLMTTNNYKICLRAMNVTRYIYAPVFDIQLKQDVAPWQSIYSWCDGSSDRSLMVDPLSYFSFHPVLHDWCTKGCGMCYPVCDGAYKRTLAVNRRVAPEVAAAGFLSDQVVLHHKYVGHHITKQNV